MTGKLRTAHGDWDITAITEKEGTWTVAFRNDAGAGRLTGRIKDGQFAGKWERPQATGTFELTRPKKKA